jgi:hypothetical protein
MTKRYFKTYITRRCGCKFENPRNNKPPIACTHGNIYVWDGAKAKIKDIPTKADIKWQKALKKILE